VSSDEYFGDLEAQKAADREVVEKIKKAAEEWRARWPNHCKACHGWGGKIFTQSHSYGMGSASEQIFEPCDATEKLETCHRCGELGLSEEAEGPCKFCEWNYNDGEPQL
jgi:DnaJ-class molecular chaperone